MMHPSKMYGPMEALAVNVPITLQANKTRIWNLEMFYGGEDVYLPDARELGAGTVLTFINSGTSSAFLKMRGTSTNVVELVAGNVAKLYLLDDSTEAGEWHYTTNAAGFGDRNKHNVIVFLVDDVSREYLTCYDNATYEGNPIPSWLANQWTPGTFAYPPQSNIELLAATGLVCTRMNVAAMCSPTRSSLQTGRSNPQHTLGNAIQNGTGSEEFAFEGIPLFELMFDQGSDYERIHIGKWHITENALETVDGMGPDQASAIVAHKRVVTRGKATYFQGNSANHQNVPGIATAPINHVRHAWCIHDDRDNPRPFIGHAGGPYDGDTGLTFDLWFTPDVGTSNALELTTEAAKQAIIDADTDGKLVFMHCWFHAPHTPSRWTGSNVENTEDANQDEFGVAQLSAAGYHSYGTTPPDGVNRGTSTKAMMESIDHAIGEILGAMTTAQRANTMVVILADNGTTAEALTPSYYGTTPIMDLLEPSKMAIPESNYDVNHSKRSPWQGGTGAFCIINGPAVENPGDGTTPRFWHGLVGVEDLFNCCCTWTDTRVPVGERHRSFALVNGVRDFYDKGREVYYQIAFKNGFAADPFSEAQGTGSIRFIACQNHAGWKLLWIKVGAAPAGEVTWEWQLYDMPNDPLEATDIFAAAKAALGGTPTVQQVYDTLTVEQKIEFNEMYRAMEADDYVPPDMDVVLDVTAVRSVA